MREEGVSRERDPTFVGEENQLEGVPRWRVPPFWGLPTKSNLDRRGPAWRKWMFWQRRPTVRTVLGKLQPRGRGWEMGWGLWKVGGLLFCEVNHARVWVTQLTLRFSTES